MRNGFRRMAVLVCVVFAGQCTAQEINEEWNFPEARQFDFWVGEWSVSNRFKQDDNSWKDEGGATVRIFRVLGGRAIMEFWDGTARGLKETKGFSLRYFDSESNRWKLALNWPQPNNGGFFFLEGVFRHNRGEFLVDYKNREGQMVINRYTFSDIGPNSLRWNDGTSLDGGKTWETNWIMEFSRISGRPEWPSIDDRFHTYDDNTWNTTDEAGRFDPLIGAWKGESEVIGSKHGEPEYLEMKVWKVLNGSAYLIIKNEKAGALFKQIQMLTYREMNNVWLLLSLNNRKGSGYKLKGWRVNGGKPVFNNLSANKDDSSTWTWDLNDDRIEMVRKNEADKTTTRTVYRRFE